MADFVGAKQLPLKFAARCVIIAAIASPKIVVHVSQFWRAPCHAKLDETSIAYTISGILLIYLFYTD